MLGTTSRSVPAALPLRLSDVTTGAMAPPLDSTPTIGQALPLPRSRVAITHVATLVKELEKR